MMQHSKYLFLMVLLGTMVMSVGAHAAPAPIVFYTDALSGPINGGEDNLGAYLSIFGKNFGSPGGLGTTTKVYIGAAEVANYRYLGPSAVGTKLGIQQITVQVGPLGNPVLGQALPVRVEVSGMSSNTDHVFVPNPGRILFVSLSGDDSTAVADDILRPWRYLQTPTRGGAYATLRAGDHIVIRGGNWSDTGYSTAWLRFRDANQMGSAPTGSVNTGWIHITAYPGPINGHAIEDAHYSTPANSKGGIHGAESAYYGMTGEYVSISNLRMDVDAAATSDAAPINLQYSGGNWMSVNNILGPWPSNINSKAAGVSGHGDNVRVLGNHIYGMACVGALENHGIYADSGSSRWDIGYNWIHDISGGNLIQFFDNVGLAGNNYVGFPSGWLGFTDMQIHNNWLENSGKYGLNMAAGILTGNIWNNVILKATYAGLRIDTVSKGMNMAVAFNTFYNNDRVQSGSGNAQVLNSWGNYDPTGTIRIYNNIFAAGPDTYGGSRYYLNSGNSDAYLDFRRNLYFDNGYGWASFSRDPVGVVGNPQFVDVASDDFHIGLNSPALDSATQLDSLTVADDFTGAVSRPQGATHDIGAHEYAAMSDTSPPSAPTGLSVR